MNYRRPSRVATLLVTSFPEARFVSPDSEVVSTGHVVTTTGTEAARTSSLVAGLTGLPYDGAGVGIAVVDSGMDVSHKAFAAKADLSGSRVKFKKDFTPEGNNGKDASGQKLYGAIHSPGDEPSAITVGSANDMGTSKFANQKMTRLSGTSMATPVVAGAAALLLQLNPRLTPNMVKLTLTYASQQLAGFNQVEQGAGEVNVEGAGRLAKALKVLPAGTAAGTPMPLGSATSSPAATTRRRRRRCLQAATAK